MEIHHLSKRYAVKRLQEEDAEQVYQLELGNPQYFFHCPPEPSIASVIDDMHALPPDKTLNDKYYVGFYEGGNLIAIMDLILNYPEVHIAYIGLFMMDRAHQGKGTGSLIIEECLSCLQEYGFQYVRLGYMKGNAQSRHFWKKNHFLPAGEEKRNVRGVVVLMERKIG